MNFIAEPWPSVDRFTEIENAFSLGQGFHLISKAAKELHDNCCFFLWMDRSDDEDAGL